MTDEIVATLTDDVQDVVEDAGDDCEQHSGHSNIFVNLMKHKVAVQNQLVLDFWTLEQSYSRLNFVYSVTRFYQENSVTCFSLKIACLATFLGCWLLEDE